jgi:predicted nucleic acid binding AN1-type Zn finger protein
MSYTNHIDRAYSATRMTDAEQRAWEDKHCCHAATCNAPADETAACDLCEAYFCEDHLYDGLCMACFRIDEAAAEIEAAEERLAA